MGDAVGLDYPIIDFQIPKNITQISAEHGLLYSVMRLNRLVQIFCSTNHPTWEFTQNDWLALSEFEAILAITQFTTTLAQTETYMMGAFSTVIKSITLSKLRNDTISVVILPEVTKKTKLPRMSKLVVDFTECGKECIERACLEAERRFCGCNNEFIDGDVEVTMSNTEMLATLLDIRTVHCKHISKEQRNKAIEIYQDEYIKYYRQCVLYDGQENVHKMECHVSLSLSLCVFIILVYF